VKTTVLIENLISNESDLTFFNNKSVENIVFYANNQKNFLPQEAVVIILIELAQNLGYSAIYDVLKYILGKLVDYVGTNKRKNTSFEIRINGKKYSMTCNFPLNKKQKDKLIEAVTKKIFDD